MPVIQSHVSPASPASDAFKANAGRMKALVAGIAGKAAAIERGGTEEARASRLARHAPAARRGRPMSRR